MLGKAEWSFESFSAFQASRDQFIVKKDEARLHDIFNYMAFRRKGSLAAQAMDWARNNDVNFYIDHKCKHSVAGYYVQGTGCVALSQSVAYSPYVEQIVDVTVHEIRHAWQDKANLLSNVVKDYGESNVQLALAEADAWAHGRSASYEVYQSMMDGKRRVEEDKTALLSDTFRKWYGPSGPRLNYSRNLLRDCNVSMGAANEQPWDQSDMRQTVPFLLEGIDVSHIENVLPLGKSFDRVNYLDNPEMKAFLVKTSLNKTLSLKLFNEQAKLMPPEVQKLQKSLLTMKRSTGGYVFISDA